MPTYKVIAPGFYNGELYKPGGKRDTLTVDKPFNKTTNLMPSWVEKMPAESKAVREKRVAREESKAASDAEKAAQDEKDIENASFMGAGEKGSAVETI